MLDECNVRGVVEQVKPQVFSLLREREGEAAIAAEILKMLEDKQGLSQMAARSALWLMIEQGLLYVAEGMKLKKAARGRAA